MFHCAARLLRWLGPHNVYSLNEFRTAAKKQGGAVEVRPFEVEGDWKGAATRYGVEIKCTAPNGRVVLFYDTRLSVRDNQTDQGYFESAQVTALALARHLRKVGFDASVVDDGRHIEPAGEDDWARPLAGVKPLPSWR